jgi:hypothetical protein
MTPNEVIVKVGGEGGSVALYGLRSKTGWLFSLGLIDPATAFPGKTPAKGETKVVSSWPEALQLLDQYPWHRLYPVLVHPEFRADTLNAYIARDAISDGDQSRYRHKWEALCIALQDGSTPEDLSRYQTVKAVHSSDAWLYDEVDDTNTDEEREYLRNEMLKAGLTEEDVKDMF